MPGTTLPEDPADRKLDRGFDMTFPESDPDQDQDEEFCEVTIDGERRRIRFHDYDEIFKVPGLYEQLFYEELKCESPRVVRELLSESLEGDGRDAGELRVLDVGAGNGIVGEELHELGVEAITAVDIIEEAAMAAERDRPEVYEEYVVADLTAIDSSQDEVLAAGGFNCLTSVAALGFDDIPPEAFAGGYRYVAEGGLVAISLKSDFVSGADGSGFAKMISAAVDDGTLDVKATRRYQHRLAASGEPIHYVAMVAEKRAELPSFG